MRKTDRISHFLPMPVGNGDRISKFSKKCPHCAHVVSADHMMGVASAMKGQIALAAEAECPACRRTFPVSCVITADKKVLRVRLPLWAFRSYLQLISPPFVPPVEPATPVAAAPHSLSLDTFDDKAETALGSYQGRPIYAWLKTGNQYYDFERVFAGNQFERLDGNELLVDACLVYRLR